MCHIEERAVRDLLRQRGQLVRHSTSHLLARLSCGFRMSSHRIVRVQQALRYQRELMKHGFEQVDKRFKQMDLRFTRKDWKDRKD